jgi:hypothetical protein
MSDTDYPFLTRYTGDGWQIIGKAAQERADKRYVVGAQYVVEIKEIRSGASHRHFFACVREAWANLPEAIALRHPSPEHLRKHALVKTGFADERVIVCSSNIEATKLAAYIRALDDYAVISVNDNVVSSWTAKSQSQTAMDKDQFNESKRAVLDYLATLLRVASSELSRNAQDVV